MQSPPHSSSRARQRVNKHPQVLAVPNIEEDAAERKRVLNVLAQRRYRQRKRELRAEAQASRHGSGGSPAECQPEGSTPGGGLIEPPVLLYEDMQQGSSELSELGQSSSKWLTSPTNTSTLSYPPCINNDSQALPPTSLDILPKTSKSNHTAPNSPSALNNDTFSGAGSLAASSGTTFPDSYFLTVPPLTLLRGLLRIATRLNAASSVWSLDAISPFNLGLGPESSELPSAWRPTAAQLLVPHHPVIDLLPWPMVRDRMIEVMDLTKGRNEIGGTGLQLVDFIYDMEDVAEGVRIWGSDPYDDVNWEVGQVVFERWWFVFDKGTIEQSNYWRRQRGAMPLRALTM